MSKKKTHEEFLLEMEVKQPNIEVLSKYNGNKEKVHLRCKICGHDWWAIPNALLKSTRATGCPECAKAKIFQSKMKTHEEFMSDFYKRNTHNLSVKSGYKGVKNPIDMECLDCGYEWAPSAGDILANHGCPVCAGVHNYSHEEYVALATAASPRTETISKYVNLKTSVHRRCLDCGYDWWSSPRMALRGYGCPVCAGVKKKTTDEFKEALFDVNPYEEVIGKYKSRHSNIRMRCVVCGNEWDAQPGNLLAGWGCPKCSSSRGEREVMKYLDGHGIDYDYQHKFDDCKNTFLLPFDFYLLEMNTIIEYDGEQHFSPVKFGGKDDPKAEARFLKTVENDEIKNRYCETHNIRLIRIPYTDFDKIGEILDKHLL